MDALSFLKGLPAVLGVVGFFAYLWVGQSRVGSELFKSIVNKLRASPTVAIENYATLTPAKIGKLIESDARVRGAVNEQDQKLIRLIIILQNVVTVVVLVVCAVLVGLGIWLISRPEPLAVRAQAPHAVDEAAGGLLVDLDPLKVEWTVTGSREPVSVFLENVDSKARSAKKTVTSDVRSVIFEPDDVRQVATVRGYRQKNRIRSVIEWASNTALSEVVDLLVGVRVQLMLGGKLVTPNGTQTVNTLMATIDDSTESMPENYCFQTELVGWTQTSPFVEMLKSCNRGPRHIDISGLADINWSRHVGLVYDAPDDRRIVRTCVSGQSPPAVDDCN